MIVDDFNDIREPCEKKKKVPFLTGERRIPLMIILINVVWWILIFKGVISLGGALWLMVLIGFYEKLDWILCNVDWHTRFREAQARILPRLFLSHHPLKLTLCGRSNATKNKLFWFEAMCQYLENFNAFLKDNWEVNKDISNSFSDLVAKLLE